VVPDHDLSDSYAGGTKMTTTMPSFGATIPQRGVFPTIAVLLQSDSTSVRTQSLTPVLVTAEFASADQEDDEVALAGRASQMRAASVAFASCE
jgi:hypothetical protein